MTSGAIFGPDLFVVLVLLCAVVVPIWAVVDAASRPAVAFYAGSNKTAWIIVIVVSWFFGLAFFLGGYYLLFTRKKLRKQMGQLG